MTQERIKAINVQQAKRKFLRKHPEQKIYDVTREFASYKEPKSSRIYRVTGVKKK